MASVNHQAVVWVSTSALWRSAACVATADSAAAWAMAKVRSSSALRCSSSP